MRNLPTPNPSEAGSIKRIAVSHDGFTFKAYLQRCLSEADEENRVTEGADLHRSQGKALTLKAILDMLEAQK
jgi:hypothetical protein